MNALSDRAEYRRWLEFAERDLHAAGALARDEDPHSEAIVYWAQQAAEKALKALLVFEGATIPRTHDLAVLRALSRAYAEEGPDRTGLSILTRQAAGSRYPDMHVSLDDADAQRALAFAETIISDVTRIIAEKEST